MKVRLIASRFGVCRQAIQYHIYPKMYEIRKTYIKKYFMPRYNTDEDFRRRHLENVKKYHNKPEIRRKIRAIMRTEKYKKYHREYGRKYRQKIKRG